MNAALTAKILAKKAKPSTLRLEGILSITRFLTIKSEKIFVNNFAQGFLSNARDINYFIMLWNGVETLNIRERKAMQNALGAEIDLTNILWIYRLKKYYEIYGDATYGFLIPVRHRLTNDTFADLVTCKDIIGLQSKLSETIYCNTFDGFSNAEQSLKYAVIKQYRKEGRRSHIALACGYLYEVH